MTENFNLILDVAHLSEAHRKELKEKRGFTDDVIDKLKLRSSGKYLLKDERIQALPESLLVGLAYDSLLIPYLNHNGLPFHLRPHKLGFSGLPHHVFVPYAFFGNDLSHLVLAESEFKAVASCLLGVPAIGIPGISSFSRKNLPQLLEILKALKCEKVTICFDNEVKDDPTLSNYKPDFTKRYDTLVYEFIMAASLEKNKIHASIARLDDSWRKDGKADIDGCLAQGVDPRAYQRCIKNSLAPWEYRSRWKIPEAHRSFVERKIDRFFYNGPIDERFQSYWHTSSDNGGRKLSNFTINIAHTLYGHNGAERYAVLSSPYGHSKPIIITPELMVSKTNFQKFCYELGDFEFYGTDPDLNRIWNYVFLHQEGRAVQRLRSYGFDEESKIWFFGNGAYYKGEYFPTGDDGIVWVKDHGYLPPKLQDLVTPTLSNDDAGIDLKEVYSHFAPMFDGNYSKLILGWTIGNFFMDEILKEWKVYPFLFFYGKQQSGKSTMANWVSSFFGFTQKGIPYSSSSVAGISRMVSQLSMVPVWLEEYRNRDPVLVGKNNLLRSIYDKSTIVKGTKKDDEIKSYRPRSTLIISGEEHPTDAALNSRCLLVPVFRENYNDNLIHYNWMMDHCSLFNSIGHKILLKKEMYWEKISARMKEYLSAFQKDLSAADSRSRIHIGLMGAICDVFLGESEDFIKFVGAQTLARTLAVNNSQAINVFYEDLADMSGTGKIDFEFVKRMQTVKGAINKAAFWFSGAYSEWEHYYRGLRNEFPASKEALREHIKNQSYCLETNSPVKIGNITQRCMIFNMKDINFPSALKNIIMSKEDCKLHSLNWGPPDDKDSEDDSSRNERKIERPVFGEK